MSRLLAVSSRKFGSKMGGKYMKKILNGVTGIVICICTLIISVTPACAADIADGSEYAVYIIDEDGNEIVQENIDMEEEDGEEVITPIILSEPSNGSRNRLNATFSYITSSCKAYNNYTLVQARSEVHDGYVQQMKIYCKATDSTGKVSVNNSRKSEEGKVYAYSVSVQMPKKGNVYWSAATATSTHEFKTGGKWLLPVTVSWKR